MLSLPTTRLTRSGSVAHEVSYRPCSGHKLAEFLRQQGHDVSEISERGSDPGDKIILQWAAEEERIVVTMAKDFAGPIYLEGRMQSGMIRLPDVRSSQRIEIMKELLDAHAGGLAEGRVITVRGGRIRTSHSPNIAPPQRKME